MDTGISSKLAVVAIGQNAIHALWATKRHIREDICAVAVGDHFCAKHIGAFHHHILCAASKWNAYTCASDPLFPTERQYLSKIQECISGKEIILVMADCEEEFVRGAIPFIVCALEETGAFIVSVTTLHHGNWLPEALKGFVALGVHSKMHLRLLSGIRPHNEQAIALELPDHACAFPLLKCACSKILEATVYLTQPEPTSCCMQSRISNAVNSIIFEYLSLPTSDIIVKRTALSCNYLQMLYVTESCWRELPSSDAIIYLAMRSSDGESDELIMSSVCIELQGYRIDNPCLERRLYFA